jgi:hypothetical protein
MFEGDSELKFDGFEDSAFKGQRIVDGSERRLPLTTRCDVVKGAKE